MTEKWVTDKPWSDYRGEGCPLYRITGETPRRLYAELISGSGYLHGYSKKFIHRHGAVFLTGPEAIEEYRAAWANRKHKYAEAQAIASDIRSRADGEFNEAVAGLVVND